MHGRHLYEYAVIRVVPRIERGERLNIGVVLYCRSLNYLSCLITIETQRLLALSPGIELDMIQDAAKVFSDICAGIDTESPVSGYDKASRFRWLTAPRSTVVQTSRVHPGFCEDAATTLQRLHKELVLPDTQSSEKKEG